MGQIITRQGHVFLVDDDVLDDLSGLGWYRNADGYAVREVETDRCACGRTAELLHRRVLGLPMSRTPMVDHRNGDRSDCRRANLRTATVTQNNRNRPKHRQNKSGFKGVHWRPDAKRWRACIRVNYKLINLGHFDTPEAAHEAYKRAALHHFDDFAHD